MFTLRKATNPKTLGFANRPKTAKNSNNFPPRILTIASEKINHRKKKSSSEKKKSHRMILTVSSNQRPQKPRRRRIWNDDDDDDEEEDQMIRNHNQICGSMEIKRESFWIFFGSFLDFWLWLLCVWLCLVLFSLSLEFIEKKEQKKRKKMMRKWMNGVYLEEEKSLQDYILKKINLIDWTNWKTSFNFIIIITFFFFWLLFFWGFHCFSRLSRQTP